MKKRFLAGSSRAEFLRRHWQKKPLLARAALPHHADAITREQLFELATRDDVESRIVSRSRSRWVVRNGPFRKSELHRMPHRGWTLLVQGVDLALPPATRLREEFAFIPSARLDDVMVSYAAPGGGVGPHFDSYDVFLVQATGTRRWKVSAQRDLELVADAPLKLLRNFRPECEWTVRPGDVLYLPPDWAHDGVALTECITCSVGFRAPPGEELASRFLDFLQDRIEPQARYADPDLEPARRPGRIPRPLMQYGARALGRLRWSAADLAEFIGRYLSEPKANVVFERPARALARASFTRRARVRGVVLAAPSRMLFYGARLFMNGESVKPRKTAARALARLADARELRAPLELDDEAWTLLYEWYLAGYIGFGDR